MPTLDSRIKTICKSLYDIGSYTAAISKENLHKNVPYKHLKNVNFSMAVTDSHQQLDSSLPVSLTSALEIQTGLEIVRIDRWPCDAHFTDTTGEQYLGEEEFTDLFSMLVSLFKQPQFQNLELAVTSLLPTTLREFLYTFFTALSSNHQSLNLESVTIIQRDNKRPGAFIMPDSSETLINKTLHLSNMELTPSEETLIFSYPLLSLESLALVKLTSVYITIKISGKSC